MVKLKTIGKFGLLTAIFIAGVFAVSQLVTNTYAAQTLNGNNEIITISDTTDGLPVNAAISPRKYSGDGNVILFSSSATNLKNAGSSIGLNFAGLYTYNIKTQTTKRVDISTQGQIPDYGVYTGTMSESGRYVFFMSNAKNLVDGQTLPNNTITTYMRDTQDNTTTFIRSGYFGGLGQNTDRLLSVSDDARLTLTASRYIANVYPYGYGIVLTDLASQVDTSLHVDKSIAGSDSSTGTNGSMSCDGSFVAYQKLQGIELLDLRNGSKTVLVSGGDNSVSPILSCNGRYLLYATQNRTDMPTPTGLNANLHLVRYDRVTGERAYIDSNSLGQFSIGAGTFSSLTEPVKNAFSASIADTGDIVFKYNSYYYLKHFSDGSGTLESIGRISGGTYVNIDDPSAAITSDGRYVFFMADPYTLGLASSPSIKQLIRTKTGI